MLVSPGRYLERNSTAYCSDPIFGIHAERRVGFPPAIAIATILKKDIFGFVKDGICRILEGIGGQVIPHQKPMRWHVIRRRLSAMVGQECHPTNQGNRHNPVPLIIEMLHLRNVRAYSMSLCSYYLTAILHTKSPRPGSVRRLHLHSC